MEEKNWYLLLSALLLILLLTLSLLIYYVPNLLNLEFIPIQDPEALSRKLGVLGLLILVYTLYSLRKQQEIRRLRQQLVKKEIEMKTLSLRLIELSSLFEVISSINSHKDLGNILNLIVQHISPTLKADSCSLMLLDENLNLILPIASCGLNAEQVCKAKIQLGDGIAGWVVKEGKPLLLNSEEDVARFIHVPSKINPIASALSVPLTLEGTVIGVLNINRFGGADKFTEGDLKLAQIFAHDAAVAVRSTRLMDESVQRSILEEKNRLLRKFLTRYVPEQVASKILDDPEHYLKLGGKRTDLTILFADIRGFTRFAERTEAEKVVEILNQVFTEFTQVVFAHNGYINKFIGDCLLALYDRQYTRGDEVMMALKTAEELQRVFRSILGKRNDSNSMGLGIGINSGEVVIGNIGSEELMDYTVIGDNVNIASLLQEQAKSGQTLISNKTYQRVQNQIEAKKLPPLTLRGRTAEIEVYELVGIKE